MMAPDFVAVGHLTLDRFGDVTRPGGAALFAAVTADRLGLSAGILTSHGEDFPLDAIPPQIEVISVPAPHTTVFEHRREAGRRRLRLVTSAPPISPADVPPDWLDAELVLLAPVFGEVDPAFARTFTEATLAVEAQGWLRAAGPAGEVTPQPWTPPRELLNRLLALFVSAEDVRGQESSLTEWLQRLPLAAVTAGRAGALLYVSGERFEVRARPSREVDSTGAGDVFAAAFLASYRLDGDAWQAAAAAACAAALSVEGEGWSTVPDLAALEEALGEYRARE
ncbi:MAG TPA: PfkB family carbohydrate kinase [Methylomirabilota bacterium]|jgi:sugar/nucleoside kinase (ribokinase family)|nr:PfkB family carbohydrate kinase [Methylomirabilota bacterium]